MFSYRSIQEYHFSLKNNSTTCLQAVEFYLQQIAASRQLNAYTQVFEEEALATAARLDAARASGQPTGKLHGVVVGIKDVLCYKGHSVTAASQILQSFQATYHATAIQKMLEEEAIIIGVLNCDEFAMGSSNEHSAYGNVLNALDETRVPGGSSGGSAVAVQANLCMVSLGSDTGGSVRQPADFCGIVGLKPSYGRISRYGLLAYASSFDCIGIFSKNIPDAAWVLSVLEGADEWDSTVSTIPSQDYAHQLHQENKPTKRFAYFKEALEHPSLDKEIKNALEIQFQKLINQGHSVTPIAFDLLEYIVPTYYILTTAEASSNLSRYDGVKFGYSKRDTGADLTALYEHTRSMGFGKEVKRRIMLGSFVLSSGYYDAYFTRAQQVRRKLFDHTQLIFNEFDAILLPTVPAPAFKFGEKSTDPVAMYLADIYTVYANLVGIPAISIPLFQHSNGMPFGMQVMTNHFSELSLLRIAHELMQH